MNENIHKGHRKRIKQKFIEAGFTGFNEHEILELLLFYSRPRIDTNEIGHRLINTFGSIGGVFDADFEALKEIEGIDESSAVLLKMIPALTREYLSSKNNSKYLNTYEKTCTYFRNLFLGEKEEKVRAVCLDDKLRLVACTVISEGTPGKVDINIRKLVEFAYRNKCESLILAHNHPNGDAIPSDNDIKTTAYVFNTLKPIGINLVDHIIVADNDAISMKESGAFTLLK
ncbi:MAG: RadC family protein [Porcipelethomonas sp.]